VLEQPTLTHSPENPDDELKRLREWVAEQTALIEHLRERIRELEAHLVKDSHNSSRPSSSDSPFKKSPPRSQRQPSGRKPGGQPGRRGVTRSLVDYPDQCVIIPLTGTCACGRCGTGISATVPAERRQVVEVVIQRKVIEYHIVGGTCAYGRAQRSIFPAGIEAPVQYGPSVLAFAVYMTQDQLLTYQRTAGVLNELVGLESSPGTLQRAVRVAATRREVPVNTIRRALITAPVAHADETGRRVNGNLYWIHVLSTDRLMAYFPHPKRGAEALNAFGLLVPFVGVQANALVSEAKPPKHFPPASSSACGPATTPSSLKPKLAILPVPAILAPAGESNNPPPAYNLIRRLRKPRNKVLCFLTDLHVPLDNNQAERDLRRLKFKQKVSGCFRSCLSTRRKQSDNVFNLLILKFLLAFQG